MEAAYTSWEQQERDASALREAIEQCAKTLYRYNRDVRGVSVGGSVREVRDRLETMTENMVNAAVDEVSQAEIAAGAY